MVRKLLQVLTALIVGALTVTTMSFACLFGVTIYETFFKIPDEITVPNVTGKKLEESLSFIDKFHLRASVEKKYSNLISAGKIISQDPAPGEFVRSGREIRIVSSMGPEMIAVPDLYGMSKRDGENTLWNQKLKVGKITYTQTGDENESIIEQNPPAGSRVERGTSVSLKINEGKITKYEIPIVENKSMDEAFSILSDSPFRIGKIRWIYHDYIEKNQIIRQNPIPGSYAAKDFPINLDISAGKRTDDLFIKQECVSFIVSDDSGNNLHKLIEIHLRDSRGVNVLYRAEHAPGDSVELMITTYGSGEVTIYSDKKLKNKFLI